PGLLKRISAHPLSAHSAGDCPPFVVPHDPRDTAGSPDLRQLLDAAAVENRDGAFLDGNDAAALPVAEAAVHRFAAGADDLAELALRDVTCHSGARDGGAGFGGGAR